MSTKRILTPTAIKEMMISWHQKEKSLKEIADLTEKSRSTVQSIIKKWKETGCVENQWCKGRPSTFSTRDANRLKRIVKTNIGASTDHIFKTSLAENATKFSKSTIYRQLKKLKYVRRAIRNEHQHGFLANKSCTTNLISLSDSINTALHNKIGTDIIYFDFQKAFDTVKHDLILKKLKNQFSINGCLLRFISNYLKDRTQRVVLEYCYSAFKPVNSGVPQGSILGPLLFLLFINDISEGLDPKTNISLYADDTKLWREMSSERDCTILQSDIDKLNNWCRTNNMKFHPDKCKVVSIKAYSKSDDKNNLFYTLPFANFSYSIGDTVINYEISEKDLGVTVNNEFTWHEHQQLILSKASQIFGLTKRTCHFVTNPNRKRTLYLTLVRSIFEHCSPVWRPVGSINIDKFERLQKNVVKWVLSEEHSSYSNVDVYYGKCKTLNILPMNMKFDLCDLVLFHKIVHELIPIKLPEYILRYNSSSRLRSSHLDSMSYIYMHITLIIQEVSCIKASTIESYMYGIHLNLTLGIQQT